jgi:superfamily II DNA or RNA helicase
MWWCAVFDLRPYQERDLTVTRACFAQGHRRVCYQAPTGSGKTVLFSHVIAGACARGNRVFVLGHRDEIVQQISGALEVLGVPHGFIAAGQPELPLLPVQIASVMTLVRRLGRLTAAPDLLVIDEAHHAAAETWRKIIAALPQAKIFGVTATPERLDGKGLADIFDTLIIGPSVSELIASSYLSRFVTFVPPRAPDLSGLHTRAGDYATDELAARMSEGVIINSAVDEYTRLCRGAPAIVFCVDIKHSELVAEAFRARGYRAAHVDGNTPIDIRRGMIHTLSTGELQVLCNCGLISEGLDIPSVTAAVLLRPTKSLALHLQQVGRALRPAPGKDKAFILDHAGNSFKFGLVDADRKWSLEGRAKDEQAAPLQRCHFCGALVPLSARNCPECGAVLREDPPPVPRTHIERRTDPLVLTNKLAAMTYWKALRWAGRDEARLRLVAHARGYKAGWVWHRLQEMARGEP